CPAQPPRKSRVDASLHIFEYPQERGPRSGSIRPEVGANPGIAYRAAKRPPSARECLCPGLAAQQKPPQELPEGFLTDIAAPPLGSLAPAWLRSAKHPPHCNCQVRVPPFASDSRAQQQSPLHGRVG